MPNPLEVPASADDAAITQSVIAEQVRLLYQQLPLALGSSLLAVAMLGAVLWQYQRLEPSALLAWFLAFLLIIVVRTLGLRRYRRLPDDQRDHDLWRRRHEWGSFAAGLGVGVVAFFPPVTADLREISFALIVFTGLSAGALSTSGASFRSVLAYVLPLILPAALRLSAYGSGIPLVLGLLLILFLIVIGLTAVRHSRTLEEAFRLRFRNTALYREMQQATEQATRMAADLQQEVDKREQAERHLSAYAKRLQRANDALQREVAERERNEQQLTQQALSILESEVRMRAVFQNAFDAIITFDENGRIDSANPAACSLFGYSERDLVGRDIATLIPDAGDLTASRELLEQEGCRADGSRFPLALGVERMFVGQDVQYVCILRDQTAASEAREALVRAKETAETANKAKSEFLSSMSHELRTPLNAIIGFAQLLQNDPTEPLTEGQAESVEQIGSAGWHLLQLINDVLDLAKIEAGRMDISPGDVLVAELVQECLGLVQGHAEQREIRLVDETGGANPVLFADYVRVKQVLLNLLSNAIKYNRDGGQVTLLAPDINDGRCRLALRDTGSGLTAEQIDAIFAPFSRVAENKAEIEGTGIGLTITKRLLEMMGGSIGVQSTPGEGSTFWFELPLAGHGAEAARPHAETAAELGTGAAVSGPRRILYVEDNPANLKLVQSVIRNHRPNYELICADEGERGLELALTDAPDLILLDISLPGLSGFEILEALRQSDDTRRIPALALSANAMPDDIEKGRQAGFRDYLTKPIDVKQLLAALDAHLSAGAA